jgi:hypothetical protein
MTSVILDEIPFNPKASTLLEQASVNHSASARAVEKLVQEAQSLARPRGGYVVAMIDELGPDYVIVDGRRIMSSVLRINLANTKRVFPYVATGGVEIEKWANSQADPIYRFWAERISEMALRAAIDALTDHLETHLQTGPTSKVNPGSTIDWPLEGQRELFGLFGETASRIGVTLADNLWMHPKMSSSGIRYPSKENLENCSLCPREDCRLRKAPYQEGLYDRKYRQS